jgi:GxxExxY protein
VKKVCGVERVRTNRQKVAEDQTIESVASAIVDSAIKVHRTLRPGLLESAYQACLAHELRNRGLTVDCEITFPVVYEGIEIDNGYRVDMLIQGCVLVENKTVDRLLPIHDAQLLIYMKLGGYKLGFLLNWKVTLMKHGIKRLIL